MKVKIKAFGKSIESKNITQEKLKDIRKLPEKKSIIEKRKIIRKVKNKK